MKGAYIQTVTSCRPFRVGFGLMCSRIFVSAKSHHEKLTGTSFGRPEVDPDVWKIMRVSSPLELLWFGGSDKPTSGIVLASTASIEGTGGFSRVEAYDESYMRARPFDFSRSSKMISGFGNLSEKYCGMYPARAIAYM